MARATFVKAARKDYPEAGIKKGDSYWFWQLYRQPKRMSKEKPRASQLTGSAFLQQYYGFIEQLEDTVAEDINDLETQMLELAGLMRELADEQRNNKDNMPESLQDSDTAQMLEERADGLEAWADEIESIDYSFEPELDEEISEDEKEEESERQWQERKAEIIDEIAGADPGLN